MKKKFVISGIVLGVLCAVIVGFLLNKQEEISVYLKGDMVEVDGKINENQDTYISLSDIFSEGKIEFRENDGEFLAKGKKLLRIDKTDGKVLIDEKLTDYEVIVENNEIMSSPYLVGEIMGFEVMVEKDKVYLVDGKVVSVKFRESEDAIKFEYSDEMFFPSAFEYNNTLAKMSLGLAVSSFSSREADSHWGEDGEFGRDRDIIDLYKEMGFENVKTYNYDKSLNDSSDKVAFATGEKYCKINDKKYRILSIVIRGGGYGNEWASNFRIGKGKIHSGFETASTEVLDTVLKEIGDGKNTKIWITGYSRGAAVANIVGAKLGDKEDIKRENLFVYTFGAPRNTRDENKKNNRYAYIFNVINDNDMIPYIPPADWKFGRYGKDVKFPALSSYNSEAEKLQAEIFSRILKKIKPKSDVDFLKMETQNQSESVRNASNSIGKTLKSQEHYANNYQDIVADFIQCCNTKVKDENGNWRMATAKEAIMTKYENGAKYLDLAENEAFIKGIGTDLGEFGEKITAFGAIVIKHRKNPYKIITEEIGVEKFAEIGEFLGMVGGISEAHYPESYIAIMLGLSNPDHLIIE